MRRRPLRYEEWDRLDHAPDGRRKGGFMVLAFFCLIATMGFVALTIDGGVLILEKTKMQNAVDAAALAAAIEINSAIETAGPEVENVTQYAVASAKQTAVDVAAMNETYVDPAVDVIFGRRTVNSATGSYQIEWDITPANVVKVVARRDNDDPTAPDAKVPVSFAGVGGSDPSTLYAEATAYVDPRDIVAVIDFSGSMSHLSQFKPESMSTLGNEAIEANLSEIFTSLGPVDVGGLETAPEYLTVYSPPSENVDDPVVDVTFKHTSAEVSSNKPYQKVKLDFTDGTTETINGNVQSGEYSGSGENAGKDIDTVWTVFITDVTVTGQAASGCSAEVQVTFMGDGVTIFVESSKDLSNVVIEFEDGTHQKFDDLNLGQTGSFAGTGDNAGKKIAGAWIKSGCNDSGDGPGYGERFYAPSADESSIAIEFDDNNENVMAFFDLDVTPYPYPSGDWVDYLNYVRNDDDVHRGGFTEMYGGVTFAQYLLELQPRGYETPDLWKTPHYPFHAVKEGVLDLATFLQELGFDDYLGLVSYDAGHRIEDFAVMETHTVDVSAQPLTNDFTAIQQIMTRKQAAEYASSTNIAGGILEAQLMLDEHGRDSARPTMLVMTDGVPTMAEPYTIPADWNWSEDFDYNRDGVADYYLTGGEGNYDVLMSTLVHAKLAADAGTTIHTLTVGTGADEALMEAIAWIGGGEYTNVPVGTDVNQLRSGVSRAFQRLTSAVPPPKLVAED